MTGPLPAEIDHLVSLFHQGNEAEAARLARILAVRFPQDPFGWKVLGAVLQQAGRLDGAVRAKLAAILLSAGEGDPDTCYNLGVTLRDLGRLDESEARYRQAIALKPGFPQAHNNLGDLLRDVGRGVEAEPILRHAVALRPLYPFALSNLGNALKALGRLEEAAAQYRSALTCDPGFAVALSNLGVVIQESPAAAKAEAIYLRAIRTNPAHAETYGNLGNLLKNRWRLAEAAGFYRRAICIKPDAADVFGNFASLLKDAGETARAAACYDAALALKPEFLKWVVERAMISLPVYCRTEAESQSAVENFERSLDGLRDRYALHPAELADALAHAPTFYLAYRPGNMQPALSRFGDLAAAGAETGPLPPSSASRVRLAIVCGHIRRHSVWTVVLRGMVGNLNREKFELFLYHTRPETDDETIWAKARADKFVQGPNAVEGWRDIIEEDRPDMIFYPEIGMDQVTNRLAAMRLAPLQAASWGHPITTGLPTIDLYLSGELLEGPRAAEHYRERLVLLPGTGVCTESLPARDFPPRDGDRDVVRYALCQRAVKLDIRDVALLVEVAKASGRCEIWMPQDFQLPWASAHFLETLRAALTSAGLNAAEILRPIPWVETDGFIEFLARMDLYLDLPSFSGYTTAWQAIHVGLPVITLEGEFLRQRLAAGLLRQIGLEELIASSAQDYVAIAARSAAECRRRDRKAEIRAASRRADNRLEVIRALERVLIEALC